MSVKVSYLIRDPLLSIYKAMQENQMSLQRWSSLACITDSVEVAGSCLVRSFSLASFC